MSVKINTLLSVIFITLAALACNMPGSVIASVATATLTPLPSETPTPTATVIIVEACTPKLTTNTDANVRNGPGQVYGIIGSIPTGGSAPVAGRNFDGTWWYIQFPGGNGGYAWIAGSITTATCIPSTLASIAAPPTPIVPTLFVAAPSKTPVPGFDPPIFVLPPAVFVIFSPTPLPLPCWFCP